MTSERPVHATYRLQLHPGFGFEEATRIVPYLAELGVSHLYLSPILEAAAGSMHGYDVVDHGRISEQLGGRAAFERLIDALRARGMGVIVDIVPNHMSIADVRNQWWWDVLENGPSARAARAFDVDWDAPERKLKSVVVVPVLDDHRGAVLGRGEIRVVREGARFLVTWRDHRFPVSPRTLDVVLSAAARSTPSVRMAFLADAYAELPPATAPDRASIDRRHRDRVVLGDLLAELIEGFPGTAVAIDEALAALNTDVDALEAFLDRQNYRLAYWRSGQRDLDYRRFFDVNTLVGLRVEDEQVFRATHAFLGELVGAGLVDGVRVDHVDGLADPAEYLGRLRSLMGTRPVYVEKILAPGEALRPWPVEGTTGYDFLVELVSLFADPAGLDALRALAGELTGEARDFATLATEARMQSLREGLAADLVRLSDHASTLCEQQRDARDFTRHDLHEALRALAAAFPVYRSYVAPPRGEVMPADVAMVESAAEAARALAPDVEPQIFAFLVDVLLLRRTGAAEGELVRRFQQLTPPTAAKGVEDTAFYRAPACIALCEVGGDPGRADPGITAFHARNQAALERWPERMLATSTHDTKRSEDARARCVALAEDHVAFSALARAFFAAAERHRSEGAPAPGLLLMALQSMVGAWPIDAERLASYLEKAAREAKLETSWARINERYEAGLLRFATSVLGDAAITKPIDAYVARLDPHARALSLAWNLLKITCPGVPDFYQGCELWRHDLVDPDNRRPVDWGMGGAALSSALDARWPALAADTQGVRKLHLVRTALQHRRAHPGRFAAGSAYRPLAMSGPGAEHVVAFERAAPDGATVVVAPLRPRALGPRLAQTRVVLPPGVFYDLLSPPPAAGPARRSGELALDELLGDWPVALLHREGMP